MGRPLDAGPVRLQLDGLPSAVGAAFGPTPWLRIDQRRIDLFAEATGDHQWIHVDPVRAERSPFGGTIAHGHLTASLCSYYLPQLYVVEGAAMAVNYGSDRIRFPSPLVSGSDLRGNARIVSVDLIAGGFQVKTEATLEPRLGTKPACVAELITRYLR
ncbi:MaoC family dehydratase [uncultured Jatrophihabitans sp.]|uniref:MaoC family dehydratase n=1 Tax=uncultured Jatrophihabitans sp. TaxID=1610747 RepID=UPI0035CA1D60